MSPYLRREPPARADRSDAEQFARELPAEFIGCRARQHLWEPATATWDREARAYDIGERCARCASTRRQLISQRGEVLRSVIDYAEGYLAKGIGRIVGDAKDAVRLEMVTRMVGGAGQRRRRAS